TGVKILAVLDIIAGVMTIAILLAIEISIKTHRVKAYEHFHWGHDGVEYSSRTPLDLPMLEDIVPIMTSIGIVAAVVLHGAAQAKGRHEDPPDIDKEAIIKIIVGLGTTILLVTEAFGVLLKLYFVWAIKSCAYWMERGVDPYAPIYVVSQPVPGQPVGATYNVLASNGLSLVDNQPANVILGPPVAAPASDQPTASLLLAEGPQNPSAPVIPAEQTGEREHRGGNVPGEFAYL
ncbi:hypothetical protein FOZ62_008112, partial [Perkinsus olseni]